MTQYTLHEIGGIEFDETELRDLAAAWVALGVAFTFFLAYVFIPGWNLFEWNQHLGALLELFVLSSLAVGTGFLLHELAHKVVAIRFGQVAAFRADYGMLGLAVASGLAGFIFAAPGAVYHRGRITERENGLVAVAGPITNLVLALAFLPLVFLPGFLGALGWIGVVINALLAAFNMIPFGPLDGRTVLDWHTGVFVLVFGVSLAFGAIVAVLFVF